MIKYMNGVVGNRALCEKLCLDVLEDRLSHACIIEGPKGTGKHIIAKNVAAALACTQKEASVTEFPCGVCSDCRKVFDGDCPDVTVVGCDGKTTMGVDAVRFLREDVRTVPNDLDFKVYIIEDADKMTVQAQNAFLLTLEEPPSYVRFFLLCENADLLLETIRSRAPVVRTQPISDEELDRYICQNDRRAAQMKLSSPAEYAELIRASKNGIGKALEYLEPKIFAPVLSRRRLVSDFLNAVTDGARASVIIPMLSGFSSKRDALQLELSLLSEAVTDLVMLKNSDGAELSFFSDRNYAVELCDRASMSFLYTLNSAVLSALESIRRNANVRLTIMKLATDAALI